MCWLTGVGDLLGDMDSVKAVLIADFVYLCSVHNKISYKTSLTLARGFRAFVFCDLSRSMPINFLTL